MNRRRRTPALVVVLGESKNDVDALRLMLEKFNPELATRIKPLLNPPSLTRDAKEDAIAGWVDAIESSIQALRDRGKKVGAILVHRDADGPDQDGAEQTRLDNQLAPLRARGVVPVETIESWWLLYADATEAVRPRAWRGLLPRVDRNTDGIRRPKEELQRLTRPSRHEYAEADSLQVAEKILEGHDTTYGTSPSHDRFKALAASLLKS